jgi:hypothetical protein
MTEHTASTSAEPRLDDDLAVAKTIAWITLDTPGVAGMSGGRFAEAATYGRGESVRGVVVRPNEVEVHVVATFPDSTSLPRTAERLRSRIASHVPDREVTIYIDDLAEEGA